MLNYRVFSFVDDPAPSSNGPSMSNDDIFNSFVSGPSPSTGVATTQNPVSSTTSSATSPQAENSTPASSSSSGLDEALFGDNSQGGENAKSTKDSIMALFGPGGGGGNQQMFGVPGNGHIYLERKRDHFQMVFFQIRIFNPSLEIDKLL